MTTNTASRALKPIDEFRGTLDKMQPQFRAALPSHIPAEKFQRVVMTAVGNSPKLLDVNRPSLYSACMRAAQDGLLPDGREGAIVEFKGTAQWMPMISGILKKVRNSGELASLHAAVVYEKEVDGGKFNYWIDSDGQHIEHRPILFGDRGKPVGVYAMAKTKDGSVYIEPLAMGDIDKIRAVSRAANGPWTTWWDEMAKKSAIRRLAKRLPQSTDLESVLESDKELFTAEEADGTVLDGATGEVMEQPAKKRQTATRLKAVKDAPEELPLEPEKPIEQQVAEQNQQAAASEMTATEADYEDVI